MSAVPLLAGFLGEVGSWAQVILGVGLLIFIHEAGHFVAAKWAGVRVLAFSLGFGPEMFGFTRSGTRYRIAWVPLGGYVKMSGENELPGGGVAPPHLPPQPVWTRAIIMIAGGVMNAVLGFLLFAASFLAGVDATPAVVGAVVHGGPAWEAGIRPGDRVVGSGGNRVLTFEDLMYATIGGAPVDLEVERGGATRSVHVVPVKAEGAMAPSIGVVPAFSPEVAVAEGGAAAKAGFASGDRILSIGGVPASILDLRDEEIFRTAVLPDGGPLPVVVERAGRPVALLVEPSGKRPRIGITPLRQVVDRVREGGAASAAGWKPGDRRVALSGAPLRGAASLLRGLLGAPAGAAVRVEREGGAVDLPLPDGAAARLDLLRDLRFAFPDSPAAVEVHATGPGDPANAGPSPAEAAGIPNGARITAVDGAAVTRFSDVARRIRDAEGKPVEIAWTGSAGDGKAVIPPADYPEYPVDDLGASPVAEVLRISGPGEAAALAVGRCVQTTRNIVATIGGIFGGSVDKSNLGGPVAIAQITKQGTEAGLGRYLAILAALSINLMFLNILPIPLLDGGQLMLLSVEAVTRKPPKEWVLVASQWIGLVVLLGLMVMVTFNDIARLVGP